MNELKPCPFCGGRAELVKYSDVSTISRVFCTSCKVMLGWNRRAQAVAKWNRRAPIDSEPNKEGAETAN